MFEANNISIDAMDRMDVLKRLKSCLDEVCKKIAEKYQLYDQRRRAREAFILDALMRFDCYGCIVNTLTEMPGNDKIDAIYSQNHALATNLLVETLRYYLNVNGLPVSVISELEGGFGRIDVAVIPTRTGVILELDGEVIIIEIKTGESFSYSQLLRYMLEKPAAILVLWRVTEDQVIVLKGEELRRLLIFYAMAALHRGLSILKGIDATCNHNKAHGKAPVKNPQEVVDKFLKALQDGLPKVVETVFKLLGVQPIYEQNTFV